MRVDRGAAHDHVDAGSDHRRGVDERGDRRRARHRVGQPDVQRYLSGLARRADEEEDCDRSDAAREDHTPRERLDRHRADCLKRARHAFRAPDHRGRLVEETD